MIGNLPERDMAMLEERIKRVSKSRPATIPSAAAAAPRTQEPQEPAEPMPAAAAPQSGLPRPGSSQVNRNIPSGFRRYQQQQAPAPQSSTESRLPMQRYSPGHGSSGGGPRDRPVSGAFTLDFDKIESGSMAGSIGGPQLVNHNLDDIFNDSPVMLPPTLAGKKGSCLFTNLHIYLLTCIIFRSS